MAARPRIRIAHSSFRAASGIGSVGTGRSDGERRRLVGLLTVAAWPTLPFDRTPRVSRARWVLTRLVAEIHCTARTARTRAGYLRHPSWHRLRPDLASGDPT
ncbi:hypothetical protein [Streptomyces sp. NPDC059783]|uniref:ATP dependent DNA ligase n=1 Tax=Streptomyces sp. NPDC059783 TaxID=3346944 RepID=UPI00365CFFD1